MQLMREPVLLYPTIALQRLVFTILFTCKHIQTQCVPYMCAIVASDATAEVSHTITVYTSIHTYMSR
jgi:hypothetical protein